MIAILGIYFSGTGNTKYCVETFVKLMDAECTSLSIENPRIQQELSAHDTIVFGYPIYFSNAPKLVQDFIAENKSYWAGKKIFCIATMGLFSGDGAGCAARYFKKYGADILGGLHLKMPDCIGDEKLLKRTVEGNKQLVMEADKKIASAVSRLKTGKPKKEGLRFLHHVAGLLGQRLWFRSKTTGYQKKPTINAEKCSGCKQCAALCPMGNITIENGKAVSHNRCTLCYRCFSHCPTKALTILGKKVYEQCLVEKYL